ncbi:hypothetical protein O181_112959 [Austropuccinia psidii MF-1]|uniref:Uncharacterized protein n=1 Tax=Austropuccinia psidii MF-1 TaxID=1389203 RepID=A0A9Q3PT81_9BASI|nr:hypothetical protein [Austropuccinia psidii MF-1]
MVVTEGDQVLMSTLNLNNLKGPSIIRELFVGPLISIKLIGRNAVEVRLTEVFTRKHPLFPVSLVKTYKQAGEDRFPSRNNSQTPQGLVEVEDSPDPVRKIMKANKISLNGKDHRQYWV